MKKLNKDLENSAQYNLIFCAPGLKSAVVSHFFPYFSIRYLTVGEEKGWSGFKRLHKKNVIQIIEYLK